jgi:hypothetical protein
VGRSVDRPILLGGSFLQVRKCIGSTSLVCRDSSFYIDAEVAGPFVGVRDGAVDMQLCLQQGGGRGAYIAGVIELVAPCGHADTVSFRFLRANIANVVCMGDVAIGWVWEYPLLANDGYD